MNERDQIRLHVDLAQAAADGVGKLSDFRKQYVNLGIAAVHAVSALALSIDRFAAAITPKEEQQ